MLSQAMAQRIEHRSLDKLIPFPKNPRRHSDVQFAQIAAALIRVDSQAGMIADPQGGVRRVLRPCTTPGCPELTPGGPCEQHRRARQREHDERRGTIVERGYDADHRRLRVLCFQRDGWRCVDCGWEPDIVADFRRYGLGDPPTERVLAETVPAEVSDDI